MLSNGIRLYENLFFTILFGANLMLTDYTGLYKMFSLV